MNRVNDPSGDAVACTARTPRGWAHSAWKRPFAGGDEIGRLTVLPSGPIGVLLTTRYKTYRAEAASTMALTTLSLVMTLPIALFLIGGK